MKSRILVLSLLSFLAGCGESGGDKVEKDALGALVIRAGLEGACRFPLPDLQFKGTEKFTAGKLNDPAYIVQIAFTCENPLSGRTPWNVYVGYVGYKDGNINCIGWHRDKNALIDSMSWLSCGGLNR